VLPAYTMSDSYWVFENSLLDSCVRRLIQYFLRVGQDLHASRVELGTALHAPCTDMGCVAGVQHVWFLGRVARTALVSMMLYTVVAR
jgi:hypothetical protein